MSFNTMLRVGAHDPFRRSRRRATVLRAQRTRRAIAGACTAVLLGAFALTLPSNATPIKATDGPAIARVKVWVERAAQAAYIDLVQQSQHGAALAGHRAGFTDADFGARRDQI